MVMAEIIDRYKALGVQLWADDGQLRFRAPAGVLNEQRVAELRSYKEALIKHLQEPEQSTVQADPFNRYMPFPLTDIQAAYLIGRKDDYALGGVGCHGYVELSMPVMDKARLEKAWHLLINRHDMLRAVVFAQGYQQVRSEITLPSLPMQDVRGANPVQVQAAIQQVREELSNRQYIPDQWPLYELFLTTIDDTSILHVSIDMLIADFVSINIILAELNHFYHQPERPLPKLDITYRDLLLYQQARQKQPAVKARKERDRQYWLARIDQMPEAPALPLADRQVDMQKAAFERHPFWLEQNKWTALCRQAGKKKITPASAVLGAFAEVIGLWSGQPDFCINITILNRPDLHPQINRIIGDFTEVNVLQVSPAAGSTYAERIQALQQRLWLDMEHRSFSGIEVLRELRRRRNKSVIIPVVYTSTIGAGTVVPKEGELMRNARLTYGITQTPQVWIDCQVSEQAGELHLNWDVRRGIFPEGMIEEAFTFFKHLLAEMVADEQVWRNQTPLTPPASAGQRYAAEFYKENCL
ncbi:condensation domain-containing protein [Sporomusa termitida]|uniref:Phenyloxazoline synthase MbtB n=1 Tax=Sporomusa termitida TaxID=2377 RepID=A0A517DRB7_9FIRM|nr:condensation domain-containing protein [Sporomusa termitida]QDR79903.1 Phenyloxazoline synthase MbtB [Sporomusa termitida]